MKRLLSFILMVTFVLSSTTIFAETAENTEWVSYEVPISEEERSAHESQNYGVSEINPDDNENKIVPFGTSIPSEIWNISTDGKYSFAGHAVLQNLYTNYKFKGKTDYSVKVTNYSNKDMVVKAKTRFKTYYNTTVSANSTLYFFPEIDSSSTEFYLLFDGVDKNFDGWIQ